MRPREPLARPSAPIVPAAGGGGAIWPVGWSGCVARTRRRSPAVVADARRAQRDRAGHAAGADGLLERPHLARSQHAVDAQPGRALEEAHARARRRAELAVGRGGIAELRERVLQQAHVLALRADAQAADAEPAAVAGAAALCAAEHLEEALRHARRAVETRIGAQRAHHRGGVRPELPVDPDRIAEATQHPLQLAHRRARSHPGADPRSDGAREALFDGAASAEGARAPAANTATSRNTSGFGERCVRQSGVSMASG